MPKMPTLNDLIAPDSQERIRQKIAKGMASNDAATIQMAMLIGWAVVLQRSAVNLDTGDAEAGTVKLTAHPAAFAMVAGDVDGPGPVLAERTVSRKEGEKMRDFQDRLAGIADELRKEAHTHPDHIRPIGLDAISDSDIATVAQATAIALGISDAI